MKNKKTTLRKTIFILKYRIGLLEDQFNKDAKTLDTICCLIEQFNQSKNVAFKRQGVTMEKLELLRDGLAILENSEKEKI